MTYEIKTRADSWRLLAVLNMNKTLFIGFAVAGILCAGCASNRVDSSHSQQPVVVDTEARDRTATLDDLDMLIRRATEDCERGKALSLDENTGQGLEIKKRCNEIAKDGNDMISFAAGYIRDNSWDKDVMYRQGELVDTEIVDLEARIGKPLDSRRLGSVMGDLLYRFWQGWGGSNQTDRDAFADRLSGKRFPAYSDVELP